MKAYVINLESRADRWNSVLAQSLKLELEIVRIDALPISSISEEKEGFVASGVAAIWLSHQKAMSIFLESGDTHGLILEDDFLIEKNFAHKLANISNFVNFDFIQIGYLKTSPFDAIACHVANVVDWLLKALAFSFKIGLLRNARISKKLLVREQVGIPAWLIVNDIRAGGHAYVVSRKFAAAAQNMNIPIFISSDGYFMALGKMRSFLMYRLGRSLVSQSNSPTSVTDRFTSQA
jgi:GR25 family glycosyltransferase involved in LPS biosynthesis